MDVVEHTLFICREVNVFKIPPRPAAGGHKSGEWKVADKIFTGRLRVAAIGEACELRLEDASSGELFGTCPVGAGQRAVAVEPVSDSSRYFVLRLLDKSSGRHAFVGLGFNDRGEAFDFNVALSDHEKQAHRASQADTGASTGSGPSWASKEIASLDTGKDFSLKAGETIRVNVKKPGGATGGGFLSQLGGSAAKPGAIPGSASSSVAPAHISPRGGIAPPPAQHPALHQQQLQQQGHTAPQYTAPSVHAQPPSQDPFSADLLGLGAPPAAAARPGPAAPQVHQAPDSWASFS